MSTDNNIYTRHQTPPETDTGTARGKCPRTTPYYYIQTDDKMCLGIKYSKDYLHSQIPTKFLKNAGNYSIFYFKKKKNNWFANFLTDKLPPYSGCFI
jgi:hypothetical protein